MSSQYLSLEIKILGRVACAATVMTQVLTSNCPSPISPSCQIGKTWHQWFILAKNYMNWNIAMFIMAILHITLLRKLNKSWTHVDKPWWAGQQLLHQNQKTTKSDKLVRRSGVIGRAMIWHYTAVWVVSWLGEVFDVWGCYVGEQHVLADIFGQDQSAFLLSPPLPQFVYQKGMHLSQSFFRSYFFVTEGAGI